MRIKWSQNKDKEVRLEHAPFLASTVDGVDPGVVEGSTWMVAVVAKNPVHATDVYWFGGEAAFRQADDLFVDLVGKELGKEAHYTDFTGLYLGEVREGLVV